MYRQVPGLEQHPDLARKFRSELAGAGAGCTECIKKRIFKKYASLVAERNKAGPRRK